MSRRYTIFFNQELGGRSTVLFTSLGIPMSQEERSYPSLRDPRHRGDVAVDGLHQQRHLGGIRPVSTSSRGRQLGFHPDGLGEVTHTRLASRETPSSLAARPAGADVADCSGSVLASLRVTRPSARSALRNAPATPRSAPCAISQR